MVLNKFQKQNWISDFYKNGQVQATRFKGKVLTIQVLKNAIKVTLGNQKWTLEEKNNFENPKISFSKTITILNLLNEIEWQKFSMSQKIAKGLDSTFNERKLRIAKQKLASITKYRKKEVINTMDQKTKVKVEIEKNLLDEGKRIFCKEKKLHWSVVSANQIISFLLNKAKEGKKWNKKTKEQEEKIKEKKKNSWPK